jgi:hypothetical protein
MMPCNHFGISSKENAGNEIPVCRKMLKYFADIVL